MEIYSNEVMFMRPSLTKKTSVQKFKNYYWKKEELQRFCHEIGISASGSKIEISDRIEMFLKTGEIQKPNRKVRKSIPQGELSLETVIPENHLCSQAARVFFKSVIGPKFHFSTYIQNYFKHNVGKTYHDAVVAWHEEEKRKKDPSYKTEIAPQFEYNQFIRDYFADPANKGKSRKEAITTWNKVKSLPGSNKYMSSNSIIRENETLISDK
jgi:hypothetical protein